MTLRLVDCLTVVFILQLLVRETSWSYQNSVNNNNKGQIAILNAKRIQFEGIVW